MRVLVTGAYGFIGAHVTAELTKAGHEVTCAVRGARVDSRFPGLAAVACDMARDTAVEDWLPRLAGIDAVVNCAGILRETAQQTFQAVHERAPAALFAACAQLGIRRAVQISALGDASDGEFIASKHRGDLALADLHLDWLVFRPSLVYSASGSYGGTSLLRALSALPGLLFLPGKGGQRVQPISAEDVGKAVVSALAASAPVRQTIELVGPQVTTLREYLLLWRRWLGFAEPHVIETPNWLAHAASTLGERFGNGPLGLTMARMLERGNVGSPNALEYLQESLGFAPKHLARVLDESPSHVQDRWHARLYFMLPALRIAVAMLWILSGVVGWMLPAEAVAQSTAGVSWPATAMLALARGTATADIVLGGLCLLRWRSRLVLSLMLLMVFGYTVGIGTLWPVHWLDPFGGLLKNLPLLVVLSLLIATDERR
ncbi:SDR family oxidoreductase [Dyella mobilis]|uniref:SDR family oxidoreductase n=1 Tax=Dyella mobilis TaxID=1849582 RepID=A0ABS2KG25_9GAMM|nr:SDR family oxidoreductase [Dyella mobilis]MBM7129323.1 SDR family oxidoreductase [Dyella mobilis]GLQ98617.1 oxidoreductase [Dyella mobilis]